MQQQATRKIDRLTEELTCSVCMSIFKNPVSIECGHTFCKGCLLNYIRIKNACPICRQELQFLVPNPSEDSVITEACRILEQATTASSKESLSKQNPPLTSNQNEMLLIDIRTKDLLLPFTRVSATFELQSESLINQLDKFVVRQETPFNKLGIISKILFINQLRYNVYECVLQGKQFCEILNQNVHQNQDLNDQYFYRTCSYKIVVQDEEEDKIAISKQAYSSFINKLQQIKGKQAIMQGLHKIVDSHHILSMANPTATFYSILIIIAEQKIRKYEIATTFNQQARAQFLKQFLDRLPPNYITNPEILINLHQRHEKYAIYFIVIAFFVLVLFYNAVLGFQL